MRGADKRGMSGTGKHWRTGARRDEAGRAGLGGTRPGSQWQGTALDWRGRRGGASQTETWRGADWTGMTGMGQTWHGMAGKETINLENQNA